MCSVPQGSLPDTGLLNLETEWFALEGPVRSSLVIDLDDRAEHTLNKFADDKTGRST